MLLRTTFRSHSGLFQGLRNCSLTDIQVKLDETADEFIGICVDGSERMKVLINDLLEYSRVGTQGRPLEPVESSSALEHALSNLRVAMSEADARVTHDRLPKVQGDINQLSQMFQNLISKCDQIPRRESTENSHIECTGRRVVGDVGF